MEAQKHGILRAIGQRNIAVALNISESYLSKIIKQQSKAPKSLAIELARLCNELAEQYKQCEAFEPDDFNEDLVALRELPYEALFITEDRYWGSEELTVRQLIKLQDDDPELIQKLRECYHGDYESFIWYGKTIYVSPREEDRA
jgi:transcriptional regulator with XRE-family HTH domain